MFGDLPEKLVRRLLARRGFAVVRHEPAEYFHLRRTETLREAGVGLVVDAGANDGRYAKHLRTEGYEGRIASFEPDAATFRQLERAARADLLWDAHRLALGEREGTVVLQRFKNSEFNSPLPVDRSGLAEELVPAVVGEELVEVKRLDSLKGEVWRNTDRIGLKVDVQGCELSVLKGAAELLESAAMVEIELSTVPMYEEQALLPELVSYLYDADFVLASIRPIVSLADGQLAQADGIFLRARDIALRRAQRRDAVKT